MIDKRMLVGGRAEITRRLFGFVNGSEIQCHSGQHAERIEGEDRGIDLAVLDEYADQKPSLYEEHVAPALMQTGGTVVFTGVPSGIGHYYDLASDLVEAGNEVAIRGVVVFKGETA